MFCPECGSKNEDNAAFCENCGTALQDVRMDTPLATPEKKRLSLDKGEKVQLIAILAAIVAVIACILVFQFQYGAKATAERYANAALSNNWSRLYDTLYIENDNEFQTKEAFVTAMTINHEEEAAGYTISSITKADNSASGKVYFVTYSTADGSDTMQINLKRQGLLWKVQTEDYTVEKFTISVPEGAKVTVDKIEVPESYKEESSEAGQEVYSIAPVFGYTHYVEISGEELEDSSELVTGYDGETSYVTASYKKEVVEKVSEQALEDLGTILSAAAANKKFSDVDVLQNIDDTYKEGAIYEYEYIRDTNLTSGSYRTFVGYDMSNLEANTRVEKENGRNVLSVTLKGNYAYQYKYQSYYSSEETQTENGTCSQTMRYMKDGDDWKLYSLDINLW